MSRFYDKFYGLHFYLAKVQFFFVNFPIDYAFISDERVRLQFESEMLLNYYYDIRFDYNKESILLHLQVSCECIVAKPPQRFECLHNTADLTLSNGITNE